METVTGDNYERLIKDKIRESYLVDYNNTSSVNLVKADLNSLLSFVKNNNELRELSGHTELVASLQDAVNSVAAMQGNMLEVKDVANAINAIQQEESTVDNTLKSEIDSIGSIKLDVTEFETSLNDMRQTITDVKAVEGIISEGKKIVPSNSAAKRLPDIEPTVIPTLSDYTEIRTGNIIIYGLCVVGLVYLFRKAKKWQHGKKK